LISTASKRRAFKKFSFRGVDLANLLDMRDEQYVKLLNARARRRLTTRGLQRKQMALLKKLRKAVSDLCLVDDLVLLLWNFLPRSNGCLCVEKGGCRR
jgi:hypothetical protein